jgi:hypothetical protein
MSMIFYCTKLNLSNYDGSEIVSIKQNLNADFDLPSTFILFVIYKKFPVKICSSSEALSVYNILWLHFDWYVFCITLRRLSVAFCNG